MKSYAEFLADKLRFDTTYGHHVDRRGCYHVSGLLGYEADAVRIYLDAALRCLDMYARDGHDDCIDNARRLVSVALDRLAGDWTTEAIRQEVQS